MAIKINSKIRFGKPVIEGTRVTIEEIIGALAGGMNFDEIEKEYEITKEHIKEALKYAAELISNERIGIIKE